MRDNARLIIPLWGRVYADKLTSMTLPALLAPGNLPSLCAMFEVEVVIVTETKLFDLIRSSRVPAGSHAVFDEANANRRPDVGSPRRLRRRAD